MYFYDPGLGIKKGQELNLALGKYVGLGVIFSEPPMPFG